MGEARYEVAGGALRIPPGPVSPPAFDDRLYLVNAAGLPAFRPVFDLLSTMGFYNLNPDRIRALQPPDKGDLLARDGHNLASVLGRLGKVDGGKARLRVVEYLSKIVPGIESVWPVSVGHMETLEFRQRVQGAQHPWTFNAQNMSDGTLRALGILVALFQARLEGRILVVGIEEPEAALHPAAAGLLLEALREGSRHAQVIVTSHSPELLDDGQISEAQVFAVVSREGVTEIAQLDEASRSALRDHLYTAGELLRFNQLEPDTAAIPEPSQLTLFEPESP